MVSIGPYLIPTVAILGAFAIVIVAMILRGKSLDRQHRERMFLAEKGLEIPKELYEGQNSQPRKPNGFKAGRAWLMLLGTVLIFIGIGAMISLGVRHGMTEGVQGIVPVLIGVGFLVAERLIARFVVKGVKEQ